MNEQRVEAKRMRESLLSALQADNALLSDGEQKHLMSLIAELEQYEKNEDSRVIAEAVERAGRESEFFAARRMNAAVQKALTGKNIQDLSVADNGKGV